MNETRKIEHQPTEVREVLELNRETIEDLTDEQAAAEKGGAGSVTFQYCACSYCGLKCRLW